MFSDHNRGLAKCADTRVVISPDVGALGGIWRWESTYRFRSGRWALSDYNFETPSTNLTTETKTVNPVLAKRTFEMYDYPGSYLKKSPGDALAKLRIEYEEAAYRGDRRRGRLRRLRCWRLLLAGQRGSRGDATRNTLSLRSSTSRRTGARCRRMPSRRAIQTASAARCARCRTGRR